MQSVLLLLNSATAAALQLTPPLRDHRVLGPVFAAAERAVTESTGTGESSGTGRPEWGTWCDSNLFQVCHAIRTQLWRTSGAARTQSAHLAQFCAIL